jgi:hypothetical protein
MKKLSLFLAGIFSLALSLNANAQTQAGADYFIGKWNVLVKGLPNGDTKMIVNLQKGDTTLTGSIQDSTGNEISKFSKVDVSDTSATVYFTAQGYDVYLRLDKKGDDRVTGSMMDMFDAEGDRVKEMKQ